VALPGKVALVTGGTGGLGIDIVKTLLEGGAVVDVPHRTPGGLDRLREHVPPDASLSGDMLDLTDEAAVGAYYKDLAARHGGIDILINAAGGFGGGKPVHETPWSVWQKQLDINLQTAVISCSQAVPHLLARGGGSIVNVGSRAAVQAGAKFAAYAASKRALMQLTEAMAAELLNQHITVNTVLPSIIDTPANREAMPKANHDAWVSPAAIARVILFLVSDDARIVSGAHIPVYGQA
jgi:NAD(P)-dependent dehydrogenase (short-subunit alcohol dehydrogenase family)